MDSSPILKSMEVERIPKDPGSGYQCSFFGGAMLLVALCSPFPIIAEEVGPALLGFIQIPGDVYHADARVRESVFINGFHSHDADITESSSAVVREVDAQGKAVLEITFRTEERIVGPPGFFEWVSAEEVTLSRNLRGAMEVPEEAGRPVLRNLPVFPVEPVSPGDTWTTDAREVHLFRIGGILYGPYAGDFPVVYDYLGDIEEDDRRLARIGIRYSMTIPIRGMGEPIRLVSGSSSQVLQWDVESGRPHSKREVFEFFMVSAEGDIREFRGEQEVLYRSNRILDREATAGRLRRDLGDGYGIDVSPVDSGVRLVMREIGPVLFAPESAEISSDHFPRLDALRKALALHPDRDLVVTGHTAHHGSEEGRLRLSKERAAAVAEYLFPKGRSGPGRLFLKGAGSSEPTGEDFDDRRVEILILD